MLRRMSSVPATLQAALADRYSIERELGRGGMAVVYLARDLKHGRHVALKVLDSAVGATVGADRFLREIRVAAGLQHPNIVTVFDSGDADGTLWFTMPYVEGESLRERLSRERQLPVADAVSTAAEVASALDYAHRQGVVHRDVKPENVLLHDGRAMVADFGIALALSAVDGTRMTESGISLGTPRYMSPEQATGEREITPRSDVYALGAMLYEMLVGEPPFNGPSAQAIVARVLTEEPRPLTAQRKTVPPHVEAAVLTALQKLPADRFATAAEFAAALEDRGGPLRGYVPHPSSVRPTALSLPRPAAVGLGIAVLALAGVALWGWLRPRPMLPVSRQEIVLGAANTPGIVGFGSAIAPDGSAIVYSDTTGGQLRLWIKERGEAHPRPLAPLRPANPAGPSFSPDGQWIVFSHEKLEKISRQGGAPVVVSDSEAAYGSAWLEDGTIAFIAGAGDRLYTTTADGGATKLVLPSDSLGGGLLRVSPVPHGGDEVLLGVGGTSPRVVAFDLGTRTMHDVVGGATAAWVIPHGRLVYALQSGRLLATLFDTRGLTVRGSPASLLDGIQSLKGSADVQVGNDGTLLYVEGAAVAGASVAELVSVARDGSATPTDSLWRFVPPANGGVALSPDGTRLALSATDGVTGRSNLYVVTLATKVVTRLTFEGDMNIRPRWSSDGRSILYVSTAGGKPELWSRRADGSGQATRVLSERRSIYEGLWSPDGKWIIYRTDNVQAGNGDIVAVRTQAGDTTRVPLAATPASETGPALSADGRWLAYASDVSGRKEVYVRPFPDATGGIWQVSTDGGTEPLWSRDGRQLIYRNANGDLVSASISVGPTFAVGKRTILFNARDYWSNDTSHYYAVTPDGQRFLMVRSVTPAADVGGKLTLVENWFGEVARKLGR
jgi:Tol biopolymer transport system component/tRNA A-37 threonylcarbamoyl transferase component Bud32